MALLRRSRNGSIAPISNTDDAAESIEEFAHITDSAIEIDAISCGQSEHREKPLNVSMTARNVKGSKPRSTSTMICLPG